MTPIKLTGAMAKNSADAQAICDRLNAIGNASIVISADGQVIAHAPISLIGDSSFFQVDLSSLKATPIMQTVTVTASQTLAIDFADGRDEFILSYNGVANIIITLSLLNMSAGAFKRIYACRKGSGGLTISLPAGVTKKGDVTSSSSVTSKLGTLEMVSTGTTNAEVFARTIY